MRVKTKQRICIEQREITSQVAFRLVRHLIYTKLDKRSCWDWLGGCSGKNGDSPAFNASVYPSLKEDYSVRQIVYRRAFAKGALHIRQFVRMTCRNSFCLRPSHMELYTQEKD